MDKIKLTAGVFMTLTLALAGYVLTDDNTYYCESRDLVGVCDKLSNGLGTRCYFNETYKKCDEGWKEISNFIEIEPETIFEAKYNYSNQVICDKEKCQ